MGTGWTIVAGLGVGFVAALLADSVLALIEALWARRPRSVAVAAILGTAVADLGLIAIGGWLGWQVVSLLGMPSSRATVAVGLFVGLALKGVVSQVLLGGVGVPANAELPVHPGRTFARFVLIELLMPIPAILAIGVVAAWPRLWAFDAAAPFTAAVVTGIALSRWQWANSSGGRRAKWGGARASHQAARILAVGLPVALAAAAFPR